MAAQQTHSGAQQVSDRILAMYAASKVRNANEMETRSQPAAHKGEFISDSSQKERSLMASCNRAVCTGVAPSMPGSAPTATVSFVSNSYFPFPFAPTSFANRGACSSALNFCSKNFDSCVTKLQGSGGGGYAVTIVAPNGGGTTVPALATGGLGAAQATSVCSSLSSQACTTAEGTKCEAYGGSSSAAKSSDAPMHWIIFMVAMIHLV